MWLSTLVSFNSTFEKPPKKPLVQQKPDLTTSFWSLNELFPFKTFCSAFPFFLNHYILWYCLHWDPNPFLHLPAAFICSGFSYYFHCLELGAFINVFVSLIHLSCAYTEYEDVIDAHRGMPLQAFKTTWFRYISLQCKPVSNLSDLLKMWVSSPWNLSLLLSYTAPKLPGLVLAQIYILKCASHLNSGSIDPFIVHFKLRVICVLFHWNGSVPHPENNLSVSCFHVILDYGFFG